MESGRLRLQLRFYPAARSYLRPEEIWLGCRVFQPPRLPLHFWTYVYTKDRSAINDDPFGLPKHSQRQTEPLEYVRGFQCRNVNT